MTRAVTCQPIIDFGSRERSELDPYGAGCGRSNTLQGDRRRRLRSRSARSLRSALGTMRAPLKSSSTGRQEGSATGEARRSSEPSQRPGSFLRICTHPLGPSSLGHRKCPEHREFCLDPPRGPSSSHSLGTTQPTSSARSRCARTAPALTGVHRRVKPGAFDPPHIGQIRYAQDT